MFSETSDTYSLPPAPLVSVIMITYNHEAFIHEAIKSILDQQCIFPFEVIIGDDFSVDSTRQIILTFQASFPSFIRVVLHERNVGMNENFATVIGLARGKYLAFCEGDDYWHDAHKLQKHVNLLENFPTTAIVCSDYGRAFLRDQKWYWLEHTVPAYLRTKIEVSLYSLLMDMHIHISAVMSPAALIRDYFASEYYRPELSLGDVPLFLYLATRGPVRYSDCSVSTYRQHAASVTNHSLKWRLRIVKDHAAVVGVFASRFCNLKEQREIRKAMRERVAMAAYAAGVLSSYLKSMDHSSIRAWLRLLLLLVPSLHQKRLKAEHERQLRALIAIEKK